MTSPTEALAELRQAERVFLDWPVSDARELQLARLARAEAFPRLLAIAEAAADLLAAENFTQQDRRFDRLHAALDTLTSEETPAPTRADDRCPPAEQGEREKPDASSHVAGSRAASIDPAPAAAREPCGAQQTDPEGIGEPHVCVLPAGHEGYHQTPGELYLSSLERVGATEHVIQCAREAVAEIEGTWAAAAAPEESGEQVERCTERLVTVTGVCICVEPKDHVGAHACNCGSKWTFRRADAGEETNE